MSVILSARHASVERIDLAGDGSERALPGLRAWRVNNRVGESPVWDDATRELLWIDVRAPAVLRLNPRTSMLTQWALPEVVGALALVAGGRVVLALARRLATLDLVDGTLETLLEVSAEPAGNRLNDGKVSPSGRWFVFGSMDDRAASKQPTGALYRAGADCSLSVLHRGLVVANGIAWSADGAAIHFSDSHAGQIWRAPWDEATGAMGEPLPWCRADEVFGRPDGATIDNHGHYWSAGVSAGCLNRLGADGRLLARLPLPCRAPTMPCFGGDDLATLYVTSLVRAGQCAHPSGLDGALFAFRSDARGLTACRWALAPLVK